MSDFGKDKLSIEFNELQLLVDVMSAVSFGRSWKSVTQQSQIIGVVVVDALACDELPEHCEKGTEKL